MDNFVIMNILKIAFELFVVYLLYKLIFDFIIPVYQTTKQMKQKIGEMQQDMNQQKQYKNQDNTTVNASSKGDYIEFEEIK